MEDIYTFWKLINEFRIVVPMIQRDYVQGKNITKINEIRNNFLDDIKMALEKRRKMNLNFIYGSTNEEKELVLLDGQQRVSTLFLLHWYFARKEGIIKDDPQCEQSNNIKKILEKFSYQNRATSEEFCKALVNGKIDINNEIDLSEQIREKIWYFSDWNNDPTIQNMLNMLDEIHRNFKEINNGFKLLTESTEIYFTFIELKKYKLTDELYIKMNSRGKKLTNFEIFKAKFSELIKKNTELSEDEKKQTLKEFNKNIEKRWIDLFWDYKKGDDEIIDEYVMRYIYFITEMLYATDSKIDRGPKANREKSPFIYEGTELILSSKLIEETYKNAFNIKKLIDILNIWQHKEEIDKDMNDIFSNKYEKGKIALLDEKYNLFEKCIYDQKMTWFDKDLLFAFVILKIENPQINDNTKELIRVYRNLLLNIRLFNVQKESYDATLRFGEIQNRDYKIFKQIKKCMNKNIYKEIENFTDINERILKSEVEKAKILQKNQELKETIYECEDRESTKGNLLNILTLFEKYPKEEVLEFVKMFDNKSIYKLIYRALLIYSDDYGIPVGGSKKRYFYGNSNEIYTILTFIGDKEGHELIQEKIQKGLENIFVQMRKINGNTAEEKLQKIINEGLKKFDKSDWKYYLIKYEDIWDEEYYTFSFGNQDKKSSILVNCYQARSSNSKYMHAYYKPILNVFTDYATCVETTEEEKNVINLKNGIEIKIQESGFEIRTDKKNKQIKEILGIEDTIIPFDSKLFDKNDDYIEMESKLINKIKDV